LSSSTAPKPPRRVANVEDKVQPSPIDPMYKEILEGPDDFDYEEQARLNAIWDKELAGLTFKKRVKAQMPVNRRMAGFSRAALLRRSRAYRI
jgi:hypothetical protein